MTVFVNNDGDHDNDHDDEDYGQPNSVDDHEDEDEDVSLGDISQDEIDRLNEDPEDEVRSATSVQNNENENENEDEAELTPEDKGPRHSSRESVPNVPMNISSMSGQSYFQLDEEQRNKVDSCHNLIHQTADHWEYPESETQVIAMFMDEINKYDEVSFAQQYLLHEGLKRYGREGRFAAKKEIKQLHDRVCFRPIDVASMTKEERRKAQVALMFLTVVRMRTRRQGILRTKRQNAI